MRKTETVVSFELKDVIAGIDKKIDGVQSSIDLQNRDQNNEIKLLNDKVSETNNQLAILNTNMSNMMNTLASHEKRITELEKHDETKPMCKAGIGKDALVQCVPLLAKGIVIALTIIGTMIGCSGYIAKILGK